MGCQGSVVNQSTSNSSCKIITLYYPKGKDQEIDQYLDLSYSRQGQDVRYALNDDKLRALGWEPKAIFDKELPSIVDYYKNNFIW